MKAYTNKQYYVKEGNYHGYVVGWRVCRNSSIISNFRSLTEAEAHAKHLNKQFGDVEAYELLNALRSEITLYEDGEFSAESILESIKAMLDSREK